MADWDLTQIGVLEHDTAQGHYNSIAAIDVNHYILAYAGPSNHGYIKTFSVASNGAIEEIDSLEHDATIGAHNCIKKLDGTHFILAYASESYRGFVKTISIDSDFDNITVVDSIEHDVVDAQFNDIALIDSSHFALAYAGSSADGYLKTFSISAGYEIAQISAIEHDTLYGYYNSLQLVDASHLILTYQGDGTDGFIKTFSFDENFDNLTQLQVLEHDTTQGTLNQLQQIDSTHYFLSYSTSNYGGKVKTLSINESYVPAVIDNETHSAELGTSASLAKISNTHYCLAYSTYLNDGVIKIFAVDEAYSITSVEELIFDADFASHVSIVFNGGMLVLAYGGTDTDDSTAYDGFIKTFSIEGIEIEEPETPTSTARFIGSFLPPLIRRAGGQRFIGM